MRPCPTAYCNGAFVAVEKAALPLMDRGLLFGHAAYEVTAVFAGRAVDEAAHLARLERTLTGLALPMPLPAGEFAAIQAELIVRNGLEEGLVYLQVTAGAGETRDFAGPETFAPSLFAFCQEKSLIGAPARDGISAILVEETRWARRDLKTTQLVSQALAYRRAREQGAATAVFVEHGRVTEAASANVWMVDGEGRLTTRDLSPAILAGVTRAAVLESEAEVLEATFSPDALAGAREAFTSSAGALIVPLVELDGRPIGTGRPGPVTRRVQRAYYARLGADLADRAPWARQED